MIRFGSFHIDPRTWLLTRDGRPVELSPRLVEILGYIVARSGEIVTKDELLERFWPDVHITENTLTRAIADIRKAIGDDAAKPQYLQTVSRRGYRFAGASGASGAQGAAGAEGASGAQGAVGATSAAGASGASGAAGAADPFQQWVKGRLALECLDATRLNEAVSAFESTVAELPRYAPAHAGLANAYLLQYERTRSGRTPDHTRLERAIAAAQQACAIEPTLGEGWAVLGYALCAAGRLQEGQAASRRAAALEPENWRHHYRLAYSAWGEERLRAVDRTLALMPGFAPARMLSCMVFVARGTLDRAEREAASGAEAQRQHQLHPTPLPAVGHHWLLGLIRRATGRTEEAMQLFDEELNAASTHVYGSEFAVNAHVAKGFTYLLQQHLDHASAAFARATELSPGHPKASVGQYAVARQSGDADAAAAARRAVESAVDALRHDHRDAEAALASAGMKIVDGDAAAATADLDQLLVTAPPGPAGWIIPIDPMLALLHENPGKDALFARLAARAI